MLVRVERGDVGDAEERSGGGSQGFRMVGAGGAFEEEYAGGSEGFGGADYGSGVAWVLQGVEDDHEAGAVEDLFEGPGGGAD